MTAQRYDLHIEQGADWPGVGFPIFDANGTPFDVTGCTAQGEIRLAPRAAPVLFTWDSTVDEDTGLIVLTSNLVIISTTAAQSSLWTFRTARYDVELHNPDGPPGQRDIRVAEGSVTVSEEVTR